MHETQRQNSLCVQASQPEMWCQTSMYFGFQLCTRVAKLLGKGPLVYIEQEAGYPLLNEFIIMAKEIIPASDV
jgi:hypothetical protein